LASDKDDSLMKNRRLQFCPEEGALQWGQIPILAEGTFPAQQQIDSEKNTRLLWQLVGSR